MVVLQTTAVATVPPIQYIWRKKRDSNPHTLSGSPVFETGAFAILPFFLESLVGMRGFEPPLYPAPNRVPYQARRHSENNGYAEPITHTGRNITAVRKENPGWAGWLVSQTTLRSVPLSPPCRVRKKVALIPRYLSYLEEIWCPPMDSHHRRPPLQGGALLLS